MELKKILGIVRLCSTPFSIFAPFPLFCLTLFFISSNLSDISLTKLIFLILGMLTSLISIGAANFWNHTNDIEEDNCNKKETLLTNGIISQREAIIISILLYIISIILTIYISYLVNRPIYVFFLVWVIITWWYSDKRFLKKITGIRLKTHYLGELITYGLAYPAYTMSLWLIFSDSFIKGLIISLIFLCFGLAVVFLKDLKDIKGDREAGLKTFGVIFSPSKLIRSACTCLILYFSMIIIAIHVEILALTSFVIVMPFLYLIKNTYIPLSQKKWSFDIGDSKCIKSMILSTYSSLVILGFGYFFY